MAAVLDHALGQQRTHEQNTALQLKVNQLSKQWVNREQNNLLVAYENHFSKVVSVYFDYNSENQ